MSWGPACNQRSQGMNCNSNASNPSCCLMLVHPIIYEIAEEEGQGKGQGESSASGGGK